MCQAPLQCFAGSESPCTALLLRPPPRPQPAPSASLCLRLMGRKGPGAQSHTHSGEAGMWTSDVSPGPSTPIFCAACHSVTARYPLQSRRLPRGQAHVLGSGHLMLTELSRGRWASGSGPMCGSRSGGLLGPTGKSRGPRCFSEHHPLPRAFPGEGWGQPSQGYVNCPWP